MNIRHALREVGSPVFKVRFTRSSYHKRVDDHPLWQYFRDVSTAVSAANESGGAQPYARGSYMVSAFADDLELSVTDVSEEDAVLIAAELKAMGVRAVIRHSFVCPHCGLRVPEQEFCVNCRKKLPGRAEES